MLKREFLNDFEQMVLLSLIRQHPNAYGVSIHTELVDRAGREVALAQIYATLDRLQAKGFVSSRKGEATPERGGRRKKYFEITGEGQVALNEARAAMDNLWDGLPQPVGV